MVELLDEESAKAIQETAKATSKVADLLGKLGESAAGKATSYAVSETVGLLGDWAHRKREKYAAEVVQRTRDILEHRKKQMPSPNDDVPLSIVEPLLEAASRENRPELQDIWARLLAAAVDPEKARQVRLEFVDAAKHLAPLDTLVLTKLVEVSNPVPNTRDSLVSELRVNPDEVDVSLGNLEDLGLTARLPIGAGVTSGTPIGGERDQTHARLTAKGRQFMWALNA